MYGSEGGGIVIPPQTSTGDNAVNSILPQQPRPWTAAITRNILAIGVISLVLAAPAGAWDASTSDCKHSECSGGMKTIRDRKWSGNTHLWIVNRALDLLSRTNSNPVAAAVVAKMNRPTCRSNWELGIWDGDDKWADYPDYLGSHFYNATGKDWNGDTDSALTYRVAGEVKSSDSTYPNGRVAAKVRLANAGDLSTAGQCYELGLALHYMGDMTQPMHTAGLSSNRGVSQNLEGIHPLFEEYVGVKHANYPLTANDTWDGRWATSPDYVYEQSSKYFYNFVLPLLSAITHAPSDTTGCSYGLPGEIYGWAGANCFYGDANVDAQVGRILKESYQAMASFIYTAAKPRIISLAAGGGEVYMAGTESDGASNYLIRRFNPSTNAWDAVPGSAIGVGVDGSGTAWAVTSTGTVYRREANNWVLKPGQLKQVGLRATKPNAGDASDAKEGVWGIGWTQQGADFWLHKWGGTDWEAHYTGGNGVKVAISGIEPWLLQFNGSIWSRNALYNFENRVSLDVDGKGEQPMSDLACGPKTCWAIGTKAGPTPGNFVIVKWNGKGWTSVGGEAVSVTVDSTDNPWVVTAANLIWKWDTTVAGNWRRMN